MHENPLLGVMILMFIVIVIVLGFIYLASKRQQLIVPGTIVRKMNNSFIIELNFSGFREYVRYYCEDNYNLYEQDEIVDVEVIIEDIVIIKTISKIKN